MKYALGIVAFVIALYIGYLYGHKTPQSAVLVSTASPAASISESPSLEPSASPMATASVKPAATKLPAAAPNEKPLARVSLTNCAISPSSITLKEGSEFFIDSHDYISHKIQVNTQVFFVTPNGSVTAKATPLGIHSIICDGAGTGTLTVTK